MPLARQLVHQRYVHLGPLVLKANSLKNPTLTADRDLAGEEAVDVAPRLRFDAVFWTARAGRGGWSEFLERVRESVGAFVLISEGYNQELATSLEQNGGFLLARPVEEAALDRILGEIGERGR